MTKSLIHSLGFGIDEDLFTKRAIFQLPLTSEQLPNKPSNYVTLPRRIDLRLLYSTRTRLLQSTRTIDDVATLATLTLYLLFT